MGGKAHLHNNLVGKRIACGRLEFVSILGLGAYGVVYLARDLLHPLHSSRQPWNPSLCKQLPSGDASVTGLYAVKCLHHVGLDARQQLFQEREITLHNLAGSHPGVVTLYQVLQDDTCLYVIMDYCSDGDLFSMITETSRYNVPTRLASGADASHIVTSYVVEDDEYLNARADMDETIKHVFGQIVDAVQYCHQLGIHHRDLKPENIMCLQGGARVMLADFGLATTDRYSTDFGCGSSFYMGPECQGGILSRPQTYDAVANDMWSLGVILINFVCGRNPWKQASTTDETFREFLRNPDFLKEILPISDSLNSVLKRVFSPFPEERCTMDELKLMLHHCDRFRATNAELMARQEVRRRMRAKTQAASARATLDQPSYVHPKDAQLRQKQLLAGYVARHQVRAHEQPRQEPPEPRSHAQHPATPILTPPSAAQKPAPSPLTTRHTIRHHKAHSLGNLPTGDSSIFSAPHGNHVRLNSLSRPKRSLADGLSTAYATPPPTQPSSPRVSMQPVLPPPESPARRRSSLPSKKSTGLSTFSRMVQHGKSAVLDTFSPFPQRTRAAPPARLEDPLEIEDTSMPNAPHQSDMQLAPPPRLAVDYASESSTDDEHSPVLPEAGPPMHEDTLRLACSKLQHPTFQPGHLPAGLNETSPDERYQRVLVH